MKLDVGCGESPRGDVNCDIYKNWNPEIRDQRKAYYVDTKKIPNFVLCDTHYLPFKDDLFTKVFCIHVLEHCRNPIKVLRELKRVSNGKIIVEVPHRYYRGAKMSHHHHLFNVSWFRKVLKSLNLNDCKIKTTFTYFRFPFLSLPFPFLNVPHEIVVVIEK